MLGSPCERQSPYVPIINLDSLASRASKYTYEVPPTPQVTQQLATLCLPEALSPTMTCPRSPKKRALGCSIEASRSGVVQNPSEEKADRCM